MDKQPETVTVNSAAQLAQNADYTTFTDLLDMGRGIGAQFSGLPYSVYRITSNSYGDWYQPANLIATPIYIDRMKLKPGDPAFESGKSPCFFYDVSGDFAQFKTGDLFYDIDMVYGTGATEDNYATAQFIGFCLANHPPIKNAIGARIDRFAQILRPNYYPDDDDYLDQTYDNAQPVVCVDGIYSLGVPGRTASFVPIGIMPDRTERQGVIGNLPDALTKVRFAVYVPPLQGFYIREGDIIQVQPQFNMQADRYRVLNPYQQDTGVVGSQLICQRIVANG